MKSSRYPYQKPCSRPYRYTWGYIMNTQHQCSLLGIHELLTVYSTLSLEPLKISTRCPESDPKLSNLYKVLRYIGILDCKPAKAGFSQKTVSQPVCLFYNVTKFSIFQVWSVLEFKNYFNLCRLFNLNIIFWTVMSIAAHFTHLVTFLGKYIIQLAPA